MSFLYLSAQAQEHVLTEKALNWRVLPGHVVPVSFKSCLMVPIQFFIGLL